MKLSPEEVERIAALARLELSAEEKDAFVRQLSSILEYVDKLAGANTEGVEPLAHILPVRNVFRDDVAGSCGPAAREALIDAFPEREGDMLKVKAVFS